MLVRITQSSPAAVISTKPRERKLMLIEEIDPIECRVSRKDGEILKPCLSFPAFYYTSTGYGKQRHDYRKDVFFYKTKEHYYFWKGLLSKVIAFCKDNSIETKIISLDYNINPERKPSLSGIVFYPDQKRLMKKALLRQRGIIKSPPGTGKTLLQIGIISCFPKNKIIIFAHTLDIVFQTIEVLKKHGFKNIGLFADGKKETDKRITVATIQSIGNPLLLHEELINLKNQSIDWWQSTKTNYITNLKALRQHTDVSKKILMKVSREIEKCEHAMNLLERKDEIKLSFNTISTFLSYQEIVIVDEAHHISKLKGEYAQTLSRIFAPIRLGFTATLPTEEEAKFTLEGLLGPLIGELTMDKAQEIGILAKPKIRIIKSPYIREIDQEKIYEKAYEKGIVSNERRNNLIVETAMEYINQNKSVLIIINRVEHGENLIALAQENYDIPRKEFDSVFRFIYGKTESETRKKVKDSLKEKKIKCVICTSIWREGVDLPSLDCVINAGGGKSEIACLQTIGRGLRKTEDKNFVIIVDFFDPHNKYLISHFGERLVLYCDNDWV